MKKTLFSLAVASLLLTNSVAESSQSQVEEAMREKISMLGQGNSFAYVDLALTNEELLLLEKLQFDKIPLGFSSSYERFGDLHLLKDELPAFLRNMGNNDEEVVQLITDIISRTTHNITQASNKNSAWISVRASTPTHDYDIPRWHIDGFYYGPVPYPGIVFKFATVLKGPSTLLYPLPDDMRDIFNSNWNNRLFLSELLDINKAESPKRGQGVFFIVGNDKISAVHSEPKKHENRLFFSVLVGTESEIEELYLKWHQK